MNRIYTKIDKIHSKYGEIDETATDLESLKKKEDRLRDLAKDMRYTVEPCKTF